MCTDNSADGINSKPPSASFDIAIIQQQFIDFLSFLFFQASYGKGGTIGRNDKIYSVIKGSKRSSCHANHFHVRIFEIVFHFCKLS